MPEKVKHDTEQILERRHRFPDMEKRSIQHRSLHPPPQSQQKVKQPTEKAINKRGVYCNLKQRGEGAPPDNASRRQPNDDERYCSLGYRNYGECVSLTPGRPIIIFKRIGPRRHFYIHIYLYLCSFGGVGMGIGGGGGVFFQRTH
ncbi:hypothetical protein CDAR_533501 [Caerostris darwini]|uniref:Uncharacterized protein n=1 Tax=Caerostris darwini TaxID=1538125 RepID=A0AAV4S795_9ARAC|nr:hypothetical protein CDAR_533501 [Caerostris darwini]